jgi:hypothetical protein
MEFEEEAYHVPTSVGSFTDALGLIHCGPCLQKYPQKNGVELTRSTKNAVPLRRALG